MKQLGSNAPATLNELSVGIPADFVTQIVSPVYARDYLPTAEAAIGTAKKAIFARVTIPCSGVLHDLTVANGETVNGKHVVAVYDTGQAKAGYLTPLYQSKEVSASGEKAWQVVASPELNAYAGEQLLFAVMNTGTTHTYGTKTAAKPAITELPAEFAATTGGAKPKLNAKHTFAEAKFVQIKESELEVTAEPLIIIGRIV